MDDTSESLIAIGFAQSGSEPACWRAVRIRERAATGNSETERGTDPACSPALRYWRAMLARKPSHPAYRITRIAS
jgi:hypothetical protein